MRDWIVGIACSVVATGIVAALVFTWDSSLLPMCSANPLAFWLFALACIVLGCVIGGFIGWNTKTRKDEKAMLNGAKKEVSADEVNDYLKGLRDLISTIDSMTSSELIDLADGGPHIERYAKGPETVSVLFGKNYPLSYALKLNELVTRCKRLSRRRTIACILALRNLLKEFSLAVDSSTMTDYEFAQKTLPIAQILRDTLDKLDAIVVNEINNPLGSYLGTRNATHGFWFWFYSRKMRSILNKFNACLENS